MPDDMPPQRAYQRWVDRLQLLYDKVGDDPEGFLACLDPLWNELVRLELSKRILRRLDSSELLTSMGAAAYEYGLLTITLKPSACMWFIDSLFV